ncbi:MAG: ribosome maturation factor RimP [Alphaproteobacteria bacterium]
MTSVTDNVKEIITPSLEDIGLWVVSVRMMGGAEMPTLQIMIDRINGTLVDVKDCEKASDIIDAILDVEDPITSAYNLEVSTPGIDRPLVREQDWEKFVGFEAKAELKNPTETGRRRYRGIIKGFKDAVITMEVDNEDEQIDFNNIQFAKLILSDELMEFCKKEVEAINS